MNRIGIVSLLAATGLLLSAGSAKYFFATTISRKRVSAKKTIERSKTDWDTYRSTINEKKDWLEKQEKKDVWISGQDGIKLHGTWYPGTGQKQMIICVHGYTSSGLRDFCGIAPFYLSQGYQLLLLDQRAHGESEGNYVGFGCLEYKDVRRWIEKALLLAGHHGSLWLHGISMGGTTVLMASGEKLPKNVKGIISDCAFTSPWNIFKKVLKKQYHLPPFPLLYLVNWQTKRAAGYGLDERDAREEVKKAQIPVLFIHGTEDEFVPCSMCRELYDNCGSKKEILLVAKAGHAQSYYKDTAAYEKKISEFLKGKR